ncbi:hypothetical protein ACLOJK_017609 [Asimina triloba]
MDSSQLKSLAMQPPPRGLEVQKFAEARAPEVEALHSIVSARVNNDFRSRRSKRRRTTGHDNRIAKNRSRKRRKLGKANDGGGSKTGEKDGETAPRRVRRRIELKNNPASGFCVSGDGTKRLRTHVWHAKRFEMTKRWGFYLPLGLQGRGRGSRALLKWLKNGALESLMKVLRMVMVPTPPPFSEKEARYVSCGFCYGNAMMDESGASVNCFSLEGKLAKLDIMGTKAIEVLRKILRPVSGISLTGKDLQLKKCSAWEADSTFQLQKSCVLEHAEQLPSRAILSLTVEDPRDIQIKADESVPETPTCSEGNLLAEDVSEEHASLTSEAPNNNEEITSSLWLKSDAHAVYFSDSQDLWVSLDQVNPPMEENLLCSEKHQRHLSFFYLDKKNAGTLTTGLREGSGRCCPVLLLRNASNEKDTCKGWSIILPLSWVRAFWIPFVCHGARAIGLRERQWVACDAGVPSFPYDFPDCKSYSCLMSTEAAACDKRAEQQSLSIGSSRSPIPPPWDCVRFTVKEKFTSMGDDKELDRQIGSTETVFGSSLVDSECGNYDTESLEAFPGLVARTADALSAYLSEIYCRNILLFPNRSTRKKSFSDLIDGGWVIWAPKGTIQIPVNDKLCFVRVLLHSHKEGVFEKGAIVCAPEFADSSLWRMRSEEQDGLKIPQSSIKSYFRQQPSGKWELQVPEDPAARQSHRWPIGFVTTGFVRGSAKPVAEAFCEATMLACLRGEQWRELQEKGRPDVFVLVRNMRSTAYRLALATIVLEQQEEDMEFMICEEMCWGGYGHTSLKLMVQRGQTFLQQGSNIRNVCPAAYNLAVLSAKLNNLKLFALDYDGIRRFALQARISMIPGRGARSVGQQAVVFLAFYPIIPFPLRTPNACVAGMGTEAAVSLRALAFSFPFRHRNVILRPKLLHKSSRIRICCAPAQSQSVVPTDAAAVKSEYKPGIFDDLLLAWFRTKMAQEVGWDSHKPGYDGLMEVVNRLMMKGQANKETEHAAVRVLRSLFPPFLVDLFRMLVAPIGGGKLAAMMASNPKAFVHEHQVGFFIAL